MPEPIKVFFSYSHKDEELRDELAKHLSILEQQRIISAWHDRKIGAGSEWANEIDDNLNTAHIILLLISSDFLNSKYCSDIEMEQALKRHEIGEACVIPIILRPVYWKGASFGQLQAFPKNAQPVTIWSDRDAAFTNVTEGIAAAADRISKSLAAKVIESEQAEAQQAYRTQVEAFFKDGWISPAEHSFLEMERKKLKLAPDQAFEIEAAVEKGYQAHQQSLQEYRDVLVKEFQHRDELSPETRDLLRKLQQAWGLSDDEVNRIEQVVIEQKNLEQQRQQEADRKRAEVEALQEQERQRQQAEVQKRKQQGAEELRKEQEAEALRKQQEAEALRKQQEAEKQRQSPNLAPSVVPGLQAKPELQRFEFQVATVDIKRSGWFGGKVTCDISRSPGQAEYFAEDLGNGNVLEMVAIPGGKFLMGSPESEPDRFDKEGPQHWVTVKPFFMGKFPVTQAQWQVVAQLPKINIDLNSEPSHFKGVDLPVEQVSWYEAVEFCDRLSHKTGRSYRLPSEAEWEYACRAKTTTPFHFGEMITPDLVNYNGNATYNSGPKGTYRGKTTVVGSLGTANAFGLYDMHGNVWEWCADHWHENYEGAPTNGAIWSSSDEKVERAVRGGSWYAFPRDCRSAFRNGCSPDGRGSDLGFRVVCLPA
ncbi:MAG: SUMF1/EgtB/PvdO family nonheme iron enzyme [Cyanothece sp. SIO1E1]|nr:SUMF1/EgtB/PvdO family nonheme iron enzyme [Cyanothece sp. SIO1E1]